MGSIDSEGARRVPEAKASAYGCLDVRAEARTYLRCKNNGNRVYNYGVNVRVEARTYLRCNDNGKNNYRGPSLRSRMTNLLAGVANVRAKASSDLSQLRPISEAWAGIKIG
jgi:hypothetical protein